MATKLRTNPWRWQKIWEIIWAWAGRVPLRQKMFGIVVTSLFTLGFAIAMWVRRGLGGWLSYLLSEERVAQAMAAGTRGVFFVTLLAILIGMVIAWLMTWVLSQPILHITRVAQAVEAGDLTRRAPVWANDEIGNLAEMFNAMIESLEHSRRALELSNAELRRRNKELAILYELAGAGCQTRSVSEIITLGSQSVMQIPGVDACKIVLLDRATQRLKLMAHQNIPPEILADPVILDPDHRFFTQLSASGETLVVDNLSELPQIPPVLLENGFQQFVSVPIKITDHVAGALNVLSKSRQPLSQDDIMFLEAIGKELGATLDKSYLWEEIVHKDASRARLLAKVVTAQEEERQRISRELHDETGQALTTLLVQLKVCQGIQDRTAMREKLTEIRQLVSQAVEDVRRLALDLRPAALDDLGLVPALEWYLKERAGKSGLSIHFAAGQIKELQLPREKEVVLYRVVQEALSNTIRHANARHAWVDLGLEDGRLKISIRDDGCGFDLHQVTASNSGGLGLLGMRERVELIGGLYEIHSKPGEGTRIDVEVRLD